MKIPEAVLTVLLEITDYVVWGYAMGLLPGGRQYVVLAPWLKQAMMAGLCTVRMSVAAMPVSWDSEISYQGSASVLADSCRPFGY